MYHQLTINDLTNYGIFEDMPSLLNIVVNDVTYINYIMFFISSSILPCCATKRGFIGCTLWIGVSFRINFMSCYKINSV